FGTTPPGWGARVSEPLNRRFSGFDASIFGWELVLVEPRRISYGLRQRLNAFARRSNGICELCGRMTSMDVGQHDPLRREVDHRLPYSVAPELLGDSENWRI